MKADKRQHCRQKARTLANFSDFPDAAWDQALFAVGGHVLQSAAWLHVQRALGHEVVWARGEGWQWGAAVREGRFPRYLYVPYGPASTARTAEALRSVTLTARAARFDFVRVEPTGDDAPRAIATAGALAAPDVQPRCTWVLDLTTDVETLRRGLASGHRSSINAARRRGVTIRSSGDPAAVEIFLELQRVAADRSGFEGQNARYHRTIAAVLMPRGVQRVYIAEAGGAPVAAAIAYDFGFTRYYAHAASDPDRGRKLGTGPPLLWQMILDARDRGATLFDFWGVACDERPDHPWAGFSRFKRAFGGRMVQHAGTWEIAVRPLRHRAYTMLRRTP